MGMGRYLWVLIFLAISLLGTAKLSFPMESLLFIRQMYLLLFLGVVSLIAFIGIAHRHRLSYPALGIVFIIILVDLIYLRLTLSGPSIIFGVALVAASIGLMHTVTGRTRKHRRVRRPKKASQQKAAPKPSTASADTQAPKPYNKFIASSSGEKYHVRKCPNAKKIPERKLVFFKTKEEAQKAGLTPCKCVK